MRFFEGVYRETLQRGIRDSRELRLPESISTLSSFCPQMAFTWRKLPIWPDKKRLTCTKMGCPIDLTGKRSGHLSDTSGAPCEQVRFVCKRGSSEAPRVDVGAEVRGTHVWCFAVLHVVEGEESERALQVEDEQRVSLSIFFLLFTFFFVLISLLFSYFLFLFSYFLPPPQLLWRGGAAWKSARLL